MRPLPLAELSRRIANLPKASLSQGAPKKMSLAMASESSTWPDTSMTIPLGDAMTFGEVTRAHAVAA